MLDQDSSPQTHLPMILVNPRTNIEGLDVFPVNKSLDSSLKKNTALIKRLRTAISAATLNTFLQEIKTLSLHKYLSEIISACYDGLCKLKTPGEIEAGVEIVSALHQRFGPDEFTRYLGWLLGKAMATPDKSYLKQLAPEVREKEEKDRVSRQRVLLRVITELWLVGILKTLDDTSRPDDGTKGAAVKVSEGKAKSTSSAKGGAPEPFPLEVLKDLLGHDREHANLTLLVVFVKSFSWDILGVKTAAAEGRKAVDADGNISKDDNDGPSLAMDTTAEDGDTGQPFAPPELQVVFKNVLQKYFDDVKRHLLRDQKRIQEQSRKNAEAYVKSGEVFEDRQASFEKLVRAQERLAANAQVIADVIGADMPDLRDNENSSANANGSIGLVKAGDYLRSLGEGAGIWYDEDERRFYENLVDLKGKVPAMLLEDGKKKKAEGDDQVGKKSESGEGSGSDASKVADNADDQSIAIANKTIGAQVDALLSQLPDLNNKESTDQTAIEFCYVNSKASRNRLVKALTDVPKGRHDMLSFWARLVATLGQYMPDIPRGVIEYLDAEFRSLQRRKEKDFLGPVRLMNIRYLAELTKFGMVPEHVIFHCLKVSLDDFSRMNIEIMCHLLEHCGRYLFLTAETSPRMTSFLETLQRKKSMQHLGPAERMMIENAIYHVNPPERPAIEQKERTPMEQFLRKLVYLDLSKRNFPKILKQIRRLHWEEEEVVHMLSKIFSQPFKVKYGNIHLLAVLLAGVYRYHPNFVVGIIDRLLESICIGLETNDYRFSRRRIAEVRFLGELYNYRLLENPVIFDTLWRILTFGWSGYPGQGRTNAYDPPDDYFRIRLVTTLLDTCGMFFNKGAAGKKLDYFLSFFQYYIHTKTALPMEVEFMVQDAFNLTRPQWDLAANLEDATKAFQAALVQQQKLTGLDKAAEIPEVIEDDTISPPSSDDENGDDRNEDSNSDSEDEDAESGGSAKASESGDSDVVVTREAEQIDQDELADFDREYQKMMADSLESRKNERKPQFDVAIPIMTKNRDRDRDRDVPKQPETYESGEVSGPSTVAFSLLTKRGKTQQVSSSPLRQRGWPFSDIAGPDPNRRAPVRLRFRCSSPQQTPGAKGREGTHQELGSQLRSSRQRGTRR